MSSPDDIDIIALAGQAKQLGFDTPERIVLRLQRIIGRNKAYMERRQQRGTHTAFDEAVAEDCLVIAAAIVLIESLQ